MIYLIFVVLVIFTTAHYFKLRAESKKIMYKHRFLLTLSTFITKRNEIESLKNKYPVLHSILYSNYLVSISDLSFDDIERNAKNINTMLENRLNDEFEKIYQFGSSSEIKLLDLYLIQNSHLYFYKHAYKYEIMFMLLKVFDFLPNRRIKEKVEKESKGVIEYCTV